MDNELQTPEAARAEAVMELRSAGAILPEGIEIKLKDLTEEGASLSGDLSHGGTWEVVRGKTDASYTVNIEHREADATA